MVLHLSEREWAEAGAMSHCAGGDEGAMSDVVEREEEKTRPNSRTAVTLLGGKLQPNR